MQVKFGIPELEKIVEPEDLISVLDNLLDIGKFESYYYDWENGYVLIDIPESVVIEELFADYSRGDTH